MSRLDEATLDDIQRDAESTARLVGAPGSPVRLRASATVRLVAEVRRLRSLCREARGTLRDIGEVVGDKGCSCECGHAHEEHDETCERCDMCLVSECLSTRLMDRLSVAGGEP